MRIWIVGKHGLLARAFRAHCTIPYIATSKDEVDATSMEAVCSFVAREKPDWIVNCSGYTQVDAAEGEEECAYILNEMIPKNLHATNIPVLHFSTDYVFDGQKKTPYTETDTPCPLNVYGQSKLAGEKWGDIVLRISWLYSDDGPDFISKMKQFFKEGRKLSVVSDQIGRPTYAPDVVSVASQLLQKNERGIFHFANEGAVSWCSWAQSLPGADNITPVSSKEFPQKARRPLYSVLSTEKVEKTLQFKARSWQNTEPCTEFLSPAEPASLVPQQ